MRRLRQTPAGLEPSIVLTQLTLSAFALVLVCLRPALAAPGPTDQAEAAATEMAQLYQRFCLNAFPDKGALQAELGAAQATPLPAAEVAAILHADHGKGWRVVTPGARYIVTVEDPPYNTCALRRMTRAGLPNADAYVDVVKHYAAARSLTVGEMQMLQRRTPAGASVELMGNPILRSTVAQSHESTIYITTDYHGHFDRLANPEAVGGPGVEVRMAHQILSGAAVK